MRRGPPTSRSATASDRGAAVYPPWSPSPGHGRLGRSARCDLCDLCTLCDLCDTVAEVGGVARVGDPVLNGGRATATPQICPGGRPRDAATTSDDVTGLRLPAGGPAAAAPAHGGSGILGSAPAEAPP